MTVKHASWFLVCLLGITAFAVWGDLARFGSWDGRSHRIPVHPGASDHAVGAIKPRRWGDHRLITFRSNAAIEEITGFYDGIFSPPAWDREQIAASEVVYTSNDCPQETVRITADQEHDESITVTIKSERVFCHSVEE